MRTKSTPRELVRFGHPVDYKIGGLTLTCRGEMTPLRKRILAAQIARERNEIVSEILDCNRMYYAWLHSGRHRNLEPPIANKYRAWCAENGRKPIWDWTPSVIIQNGASIIELRGDAIAKADRWLALCKKAPPKDGEPPPLPGPGMDKPQNGYGGREP